MLLLKDVDYDVITLKHYRLIKDVSAPTGVIPPDGKPIRTKFALLSSTGLLTLFKGFVWDGATGALDTASIMGPSAFHDWGCWAVNVGLLPYEYRAKFDNLFQKMCLESDMPKFRAQYTSTAVDIYGATATRLRLAVKAAVSNILLERDELYSKR